MVKNWIDVAGGPYLGPNPTPAEIAAVRTYIRELAKAISAADHVSLEVESAFGPVVKPSPRPMPTQCSSNFVIHMTVGPCGAHLKRATPVWSEQFDR